MNLSNHPDDSRREAPVMADANAPAEKTPAANPPALTPASRGVAPRARDPGLRGKCWWLMRELGAFTINRMLDTYADGTEKDAHNNLRHYLLQLEAFGVVERLERRLPGENTGSGSGKNGYVGWRLKRNLGILAPVWRREQKVLWDPNRCEIVTLITSDAPPQSGPVLPSEPDSHD